MYTGFFRSVLIVTFCSLAIGVLELLQQGMPPLVNGFQPSVLYFLQLLSLYTASGAVIGLTSSILLYILFRLSGSNFIRALLLDLLPALMLLVIYFKLGGGYYSKVPPGLESPPTGYITDETVLVLVIMITFAIVLAGFFVRGVKKPGIRAMRDFARGMSVMVLFVSVWVGLSYAVKFPVGGTPGADLDPENAKNRPVLVFGLDGASWEVMMPLIKAGAMPNLERLMREGVYGNFRTVGAALSSAVWTDMSTGKDRMKHGITGNVMVQEGTYQALPPRSYNRKVPAIWNILSNAGRKVAVANWRVTYPPEEVNGVMASMLIYDKPGKVFPPSLEAEINRISCPTRKWKAPAVREAEAASKGPDEIAKEFLYDMSIERNVFNYLASSGGFDFYAFYSHTTDAAQHLFWMFREPEFFQDVLWKRTERSWLPNEANVRKLHSFIDDVHVKADSILGEVIERMDKKPIVIIVSDHGQQPSRNPILLIDSYRLLSSLGLMRLDEGIHPDFSTATVYPITPITMTNVGVLALNIKGRESQGWIEEGDEAERMTDEVIEKLKTIRVEETGARFFKMVRRIKDVEKSDNYMTDRVDILVRCDVNVYNEDFHLEIADSTYPMTDIIDVREVSGRHTNMGVFLISSPEFKRGVLLPASNTMTANVVRYRARNAGRGIRWRLFRACGIFNLYEEITTQDLTPTLLYMFDLPQGRDMDGTLHVSLVNDEVLREREVTYIDTYDNIQVTREGVEDTSDLEDELERLRALGYIR